MDDGTLEIRDHEGEGYKPLVDSGEWRVAILRFQDGLQPGHQASMERHLETDEVFVLTKGEGTIVLGGNGPDVGELSFARMVIGRVYNIRKGSWHTISMSPDASVLIVENQDTTELNSEYRQLTADQRRSIGDRG